MTVVMMVCAVEQGSHGIERIRIIVGSQATPATGAAAYGPPT
jgi:hypothetical protein